MIVARAFPPKTRRNRAEREARVQRRRLDARDARRRDRSRERRHPDRPGPRLGRGAARVPRQLQGLRADRLGAQPERELAGDRRRDRGGRRRRHGRHQLLGRRAGDRAEPRHRRARARRGRCGRRRSGGRGRQRLRRLRRRLGLVARQLRASDRGRRGRDQRHPTRRTHAEFSSVGPTTISLRLKPDVAAPGVDVLSSVSGGGWAELSGTSMASPHVAGAAALLRQRHPAWTVEQLKSALVQSGIDSVDERGRAAGPRFQGGGVVALQRADRPLLFASPTARLVRAPRPRTGVDDERSGSRTREAAPGRGRSPRRSRHTPGVRLALPPTVTVPGELPSRPP